MFKDSIQWINLRIFSFFLLLFPSFPYFFKHKSFIACLGLEEVSILYLIKWQFRGYYEIMLWAQLTPEQ